MDFVKFIMINRLHRYNSSGHRLGASEKCCIFRLVICALSTVSSLAFVRFFILRCHGLFVLLLSLTRTFLSHT